jgi:hypothetical protein
MTSEQNETLLFHIAYYSSEIKREDNCLGHENKASQEYNIHVFNGVKKFLDEINKYNNFSKIDVEIDANSENTYIKNLIKESYNNINLNITYYDFTSEHPFRLTTKHRFNMKKNINNYDWFAYSEDDTLITIETIDFLKDNSISLYNKENKVYTIPRVVYDLNNNYFFSDICHPSKKIICNNKLSAIPSQRYGACWFYPKIIMNKWINSSSFLDFNTNTSSIRVKMAYGFTDLEAIIPISEKNEPKIKCLHLGYCGKYYFKHKDGFHTLQFNKFI